MYKVEILNRRAFFSLFVFLICCASIWLVNDSLHPKLPTVDEPIKLYSNQTRQDLRLTFLEALRNARHSIHLSVFGLSDSSILKMLSQKCRSGVAAAVYYDPRGAPSCAFPSSYIPVRKNGLMHQKILVIDQELVLIGSANMTSASLRMHDNLLVGIKSRAVAQFLAKHPPFSPGYLQTSIASQPLEIWLLPDARGHALADLRHRIRSAARSIRIALFTLTHPALIEELIAAKARGVSISLVIDAHSGLGASAKAIATLRRHDIPVSFSQGLQLLHHKFLLIDQSTLICGSANWTKAAFAKNSDCLLILQQLTHAQKCQLKRLWQRIETQSRPI